MTAENVQTWIQAPADSTGKKMDTRYFTTTAGTVIHREVMQIGGTAIGQIALVTAGGVQTYIPGYLRAQSATAASFAVVMPGAKTVLSPTAASFNVTVPGAKNVLSATAASFLANVNVLGTKRVQSDTSASFLANVTVLGAKTVLSPTAASFVVLLYTGPASTLGTTINVSATVPVNLFAAPGASLRNYITGLIASNPSAATNTQIDFYDRTTAGRRFTSAFLAFAGGGFSQAYLAPIRGNTNSTVVVRVTPVVSNVLVVANGYTGA